MDQRAQSGHSGAEAASAIVARWLLGAIRAGDFPVNTRLPSENDLARQFAISRASVQQALSALRFGGYVESRRGSGTVVVSPVGALGAGEAQKDAATHGDRGSVPTNFVELLEARLVLEPQVLAVAAHEPDRAALRVARQLIDGMEIAVTTSAFEADTDLRVHLALIDSCRNGYLVDGCRRLLELAAAPGFLGQRQRAWHDDDLLKDWVSHHREICAALTEGRPADAAEASRRHLLSVVANAGADDSFTLLERARLDDIVQRFGTGL